MFLVILLKADPFSLRRWTSEYVNHDSPKQLTTGVSKDDP